MAWLIVARNCSQVSAVGASGHDQHEASDGFSVRRFIARSKPQALHESQAVFPARMLLFATELLCSAMTLSLQIG